ncbi:MAG: MFS transporter [Dehalococcoidales bacterium]|nr:MFS transporter [Dehalococcoidales bacterium]
MLASRLSRNRFYGWIVLGAVLSMLVSMVGTMIASYGVFLPEMCDSLGWSRSSLSGPFSLFWIVTGFLGPLVGITVARFGPRKHIIAGNIIMVLGAVLMSRLSEVWQVYLIYCGVIGLGQAFGCFIAASGMITNWFYRRRTLAITLLSACGGIGGLVFPPLITWLMSEFGWRNTWLWVAGIHLVMAVIVPLLLVKNSPKDLGQTPDGDPPENTEILMKEREPVKMRVYQTKVDWEVRAALKTPSFWMIILFSAGIMFTVNFISLHQVAYLKDMGYSAMTAATVVGVVSAVNITGQIGGGTLATRIEARHIAFFSFIGSAVGIFLLMNVSSTPMVYLQAVVCGLCFGGVQVLTPIMLVSYFGRKNFTRILGWVTPVITLFSSSSPILAGYIFDTTGSYTTVFIISLSFLGLGMVGSFFARPPTQMYDGTPE